MVQVVAILMIVLLPVAAGAEWWRMRNRFLARVHDIKVRHRRDRMRADEALASAKRQIASLQHQLTGARLKVQRAERPVSPSMPDRRRAAAHAPLLMMDGDLPPSTLNGFADTTVTH